MRRQDGLTLVEMLIVIALLGIVMTALTTTFISSSRATTLAMTRAELQQETINAEQLIASRVKEAWYVFPPGQTLVLAGSDAVTRRNPNSGNVTWTIGTDPILALILPPRNPKLECKTGDNDGCYRFFAYYPVKRSEWVAGTSGASNPENDAANGESWVLVEYRDYYYESPPSLTSPSTLTLPPVLGSDANLLSDYIVPTTNTGMGANYKMFDYVPATASSLAPVSGVNIRLATGRTVNGKLIRLPNSTGTYDLSVYPMSLGHTPVP